MEAFRRRLSEPERQVVRRYLARLKAFMSEETAAPLQASVPAHLEALARDEHAFAGDQRTGRRLPRRAGLLYRYRFGPGRGEEEDIRRAGDRRRRASYKLMVLSFWPTVSHRRRSD